MRCEVFQNLELCLNQNNLGMTTNYNVGLTIFWPAPWACVSRRVTRRLTQAHGAWPNLVVEFQ